MGYLSEIAKDRSCQKFEEARFESDLQLLQTTTKRGLNLWHLAFKYKNLPLVRTIYAFVTASCRVQLIDSRTKFSQKTAYHIAAENRFLDGIFWLDSIEAPCASLDANHNTPLHLAAKKGYEDVVHLLLDINHWPLRLFNKKGLQPFHLSILSGSFATVQAFTSKVDSYFIKNPTRGSIRPVTLASRQCFSRAYQLLIKYDSEPRACPITGNSPLHFAAKNNDLWFLWVILSSGYVTFNERNKCGETAIDLAKGNLCQRHLELSFSFKKALAKGDFESLKKILEECSTTTRVQLFSQIYHYHGWNALEYTLMTALENRQDIVTLFLSMGAATNSQFSISSLQHKLLQIARLRCGIYQHIIVLNQFDLFLFLVVQAQMPGPYQAKDQENLSAALSDIYNSTRNESNLEDTRHFAPQFNNLFRILRCYRYKPEGFLTNVMATLYRHNLVPLFVELPFIEGNNILADCAKKGNIDLLTRILIGYYVNYQFELSNFTEDCVDVALLATIRYYIHLVQNEDSAPPTEQAETISAISHHKLYLNNLLSLFVERPQAQKYFLNLLQQREIQKFQGIHDSWSNINFELIDDYLLWHLLLSQRVFYSMSLNRYCLKSQSDQVLSESDELMTKCCLCFVAKNIGEEAFFKHLAEEISQISGGLDGIFLECQSWQDMFSVCLIELRRINQAFKEFSAQKKALESELKDARDALERIHLGTRRLMQSQPHPTQSTHEINRKHRRSNSH